jgi:large subunit ribosomal protein L10
MAITRAKKEEIVAELTQLLEDGKMTVVMNYRGLTVKQFQQLRRDASDADVKIVVAKNRLVKLAMQQVDHLKDVDLQLHSGQVGLAIGLGDEVAPAQVLADFAKINPSMELLGAYNAEGDVLSQAQVDALAQLPSKQQLQGQLVGTIAAPLSGFVNVLSGNIRGLNNVLNARAQSLES